MLRLNSREELILWLGVFGGVAGTVLGLYVYVVVYSHWLLMHLLRR